MSGENERKCYVLSFVLRKVSISLLIRHNSHNPGRAAMAVMKKNCAHPSDATMNPDVGAIKVLPREASDDRSAYCVALYL